MEVVRHVLMEQNFVQDLAIVLHVQQINNQLKDVLVLYEQMVQNGLHPAHVHNVMEFKYQQEEHNVLLVLMEARSIIHQNVLYDELELFQPVVQFVEIVHLELMQMMEHRKFIKEEYNPTKLFSF